jgi:predicted oxidoreductase
MKTYTIPHTDLIVSRIAYGCATFGWHKLTSFPSIAQLAATQSFTFLDGEGTLRVVRTAYEHGITFFDLADVYGFGKGEETFGEVLKKSPGLRAKIVIQTKCGLRFPDTPAPGAPGRMDLSREHIVSSAELSLKRLGVDHLDILLLHHGDPLVEPEEVASALDDLQRSGKVRYFGVSNHTAGQIALLKKCVRQPLVANQVKLNLLHNHQIVDGNEHTVERMEHIQILTEFVTQGRPITLEPDFTYTAITDVGTLDYCRLHDIQIQAYSPLRTELLRAVPDAAPQVKETASVLAELARKKGSTSSAIALAWLLRHPAGIVPVIGATRSEHIADNCSADDISLSREEWYTLLAATKAGQMRRFNSVPHEARS